MKKFWIIVLLFAALVVFNLWGSYISKHCTGIDFAAMGDAITGTLQSLRTAALAYLADSAKSPDEFPYPVPRTNNIGRIVAKRYISDVFAFYVEGNVLWVGHKVENYRSPILEWLQNNAERIGLYGTSDLSLPPASDDKAGLYTSKDPAVWMRVK